MDADAFRRVRDWFDQLVDTPESVRVARLAAEEPDAEIRERVLALLRQSKAETGLGAQAVNGLLGAMTAETPKIGSVLGAWTLERVLGEGGMGTVFAARRSDGHFQQTAALKVLKGLPSPTALAFLARERQILAGLRHPHIAQLLDGGATPGGQPYFVMAMQQGVPIDQYCIEHKLDAAAILRLLLPVCDAISHAHARLIIHCDLKPSNLLVDAQGRPCVLDFGIARPLDDPLASSQPSSSSLRARAFTPGFASPELEAGLPVTTATDIYSLGRLLECLLAGLGPAQNRHAELRAVIDRACALDPLARYGSVAAFRTELEAWLDGHPLSAMPDRWSYRTKKWLRRNWRSTAATVAFLVLASGFTFQSIRERDRARVAEQAALVERDRARQAEASARQISDFLVSIMDGANPDAGSGEVPTSKLVAEALARIDTELADQPGIQSELYGTLARVLAVLGNDDLAHESIQKAIVLSRQLDRPLQLARQLDQLAGLRMASFDTADAVAPAREALALFESAADASPQERADARQDLGYLLSAQGLDEGRQLLEQAVIEQRQLDPKSVRVIDALHGLAGYYLEKVELRRAEDLLRECLKIQDGSGLQDAERLLNTKEMLGRVLSDLKRPDEAEQMLREALADRRQLMGDDDPHIPWRLSELARVLDNHGRSMEALSLYRQALELAGQKIGTDTPAYAVMLNGLAMSLQRVGDWSQSDEVFRQALVIARARWGDQHSGYAKLNFNHALLLVRLGRLDEAREKVMQVEKARAASMAADHPDLAFARLAMAELECAARSPKAAEVWLTLFEDTVPDPGTELGARRLGVLACLAEIRGGLDEAIGQWRQADEQIAAERPEGHPQRVVYRLARAELLDRRNQGTDRADARQLASAILAAVDTQLVPDAPIRARIQRLLKH